MLFSDNMLATAYLLALTTIATCFALGCIVLWWLERM